MKIFVKCGVLSVLLSGLFCPLTAVSQESGKAEQILAASKAAIGGAAWDQIKTWHETGKVTQGGLEGSYESWSDLADVRTAGVYKIGPAKGSQGWNGKQAWSTDSSDQVRIETSHASIAAAIKDAYQAAHAFYFADRYPADVKYSGVKDNDGKPCDVVVLQPKDSDPFEAWFEQSSHYLVKTVDLTGEQPQTTFFSDFRSLNGLTIPFKARVSIGDPKYDTIVESEQIELNSEIAASRFDPPKQVVDALEFPAGKDEVSIPIHLLNNHIYLPVSLNGNVYDRMIFDTGATNVISAAAAKASGIKTEGALPGGGFGDNVSAFGLAKIGLMDVGGVKLKDQVFGVFDLASLSKVEGVAGDGLIGYEIARRAVVQIDYANSRLTIIKPGQFHPSEKAVRVPFTFNSHVPMIQADLDGISGEFEVDTGARSSISIMRPFATANHLVEKYQAKTEVIGGYGVGGPAKALLVRPQTLKIGPIEIKDPVGLIETGEKGAAAATQIAGNLGGGILKRFTVTLDYEHQVLYLEPNASFSEPDVFDRSGIWCMQDNAGGLSVVDVVKNSPAEKAGVQAGDKIIGMDGATVNAAQINSVRSKLKQAPGTKVTLQVDGKGGKRQVSLTLAELG
jgi:membrane-associated protease RseP (regulator of RpoE activity)